MLMKQDAVAHTLLEQFSGKHAIGVQTLGDPVH